MSFEIVIIAIMNRSGELYVHQRADDKRTFPGRYGLGAGGNVEPGEDIEAAARRELWEEVRVRSSVQYIFSFPFSYDEMNYNVHVFSVFHDGPVRPTTHEWQWAGWMARQQVEEYAAADLMMPDTKIAYEGLKEHFPVWFKDE